MEPLPSPSSVPTAAEHLLAHRAWLRRMARALVGDGPDADDLEQEVWLHAVRRPPRVLATPRAWLATVLRRVRASRLRALTRRGRHERASALAPRESPDTADLAAEADLHRRVTEAVLTLPEPYRGTILLRYVGDRTLKQVAECQGVPLETARTRHRRGLTMLREALDARPGGRRAWSLLLLPGPSQPAATGALAPSLGGSLVMGAKSVAAAVLLALGALCVWLATSSDDPDPAATNATARTDESAHERAAPHLEGSGRSPRSARARGDTADARPSHGPGALPLAPGTAVAGDRQTDPRRIFGRIVGADGESVTARVTLGRIVDGQVLPLDGVAALSTDENGWFQFDGLAPETHVLTLEAPGRIAVSTQARPGDPPLELSLARALPIRGMVVEEATGDPVAGVLLTARTALSPVRGQAHVTRSGADGTFVLGEGTMAPGAYVLTVGGTTEANAQDEWIARDAGTFDAGTHDLRIPVARGLSITGQVRLPEGAAADDGVRIELLGVSERGDQDYRRRHFGATDEHGRFAILGLEPGRYDVIVRRSGEAHGEGQAPTIVQDVAAGTQGLLVDLERGEPIRGRIVDPDGNPVGVDGSLYVYPLRRSGGSPEPTPVVAGPDGTFVTPSLQVGTTYRLLAKDSAGYHPTTIDVRPGSQEILVRLERAAGQVSGRVVDEKGHAVPAGVPVTARAFVAPQGAKGVAAVIHTDENGLFVFDALGPYTFLLYAGGGESAYVPHGEPLRVAIGEKDVTLRVDLGVEIHGRLVDGDGAPMRPSRLWVTSLPMTRPVSASTTRISADGSFTLRGLLPGKVTLHAQFGGIPVTLGAFEAPAKDLVISVPRR